MSESLDGSEFTYGVETGFIDVLKNRIDKVKTTDKAVKEFKKKIKTELEFFMCEV
jgi:hypothetical protein